MLDWLVAADGGKADARGGWVVTSAARYRLLAPAAAYSDIWSRTLRRAAADGQDVKAAKAANAALAAAGVDPAALGTPTETPTAGCAGYQASITGMQLGQRCHVALPPHDISAYKLQEQGQAGQRLWRCDSSGGPQAPS